MGRIPVPDRLTKAAVLTFLLSISIHIGTSYSTKTDGEPYFLNTENNITVHEGDLARLKCRVANLGPKMVVWRRMNMEYPLTIGEMTFSPDNGMSVDHSPMTHSSSSWDLLIKSVKPQHAGVYECQVTSNHLIAQYITLHVVDRSQIRSALKLSGTKFVNKGEKIHLVCNATGASRAPEAVDWFYEGNRIHPSNPIWKGRVEVLKHESFEGKYFISELIIDHSKLKDKGHYVCRSSDLTVDSLKVHVLNADKDNLTRRLSGNEGQDGERSEFNTVPENATKLTRADAVFVLIFAIIALVWR
ncbi:MAM domain-containing glycosylphosphatidylinositol anchor protein 1-like isoform X2 [Ruditapes philippinarum]|uniref:MAM domain-containing glycosylphosphatidylinositol anchor protein 1-like isoform X2 n=1 Tax=Ruditapes philippinarum TaxID=129788 RepID=UPI00295B8178|nr:MAM domain-containing glycosylphosphatidylinositol anchor protein 1-like isoform X2 [Ruditapes philippinarum]